ncbi:MAG TPA: GvpL/GvpF family gas vesicle protein [Pyrinomonadaceae bacterium]|nr:GvpL/GvpF family gas vesicle protein [Pyrinomonadaceae bacterium]
MSLYVYCLCGESPEPTTEWPAGVDGAAVSVLRVGRLSAVVSEAGEQAVAVTDENVLAHSRVNAAALARETPLPFRFGTRATPERLAEYVSSNEAALTAALARVRGCVEMSVKLLEGSQSEKSEVGSQKSEVKTLEGGRGTAFLLAKRREILGGEEARRRGEELAAWLAAGVAGLARETDVRARPAGAIALSAAHLVERGRVAEYRARLRALGAGRPDVRLLTSGPWPPYSFSGISVKAEARP